MDLTQLEVGHAKELLINNVLDGHIDRHTLPPALAGGKDSRYTNRVYSL